MYITKVDIENIRSIEKLHWRISPKKAPGWHVIIGDNGSGKTTVVRAITLAMIGESEAAASRQKWDDWLRGDEKSGRIKISVWDDKPPADRRRMSPEYPATVKLTRKPPRNSVLPIFEGITSAFLYDEWFTAAYGPFRRFAGGDKEAEKLYYSNPILARHLTVFGENVALSECISWLQKLQYRVLETKTDDDYQFLESLKKFVNQEGFLPHQVRLDGISSDAVYFVDGNGCRVSVEDLSDGYRSILSMTFELIRQMYEVYSIFHSPAKMRRMIFNEKNPSQIRMPGVVLIDEIDAHLHPTWQQKIGYWFCKHFPKVQFIVTTHSPLVCRAAEKGTVFRLPRPGSGDTGQMLEGSELNRIIYGSVLDAYATEDFGEGVEQSESGRRMVSRLAELNQKELFGSLTKQQKTEQVNLRATLPSMSSAISLEKTKRTARK
jgi:energy-coupling factor transporter ATP-binding protein EcfA2